MTLLCLIVSVLLILVYGVLFMRPRFRMLSAAVLFTGLFFLYLALLMMEPESNAVNRLATIMAGVSGLAAVGLGLASMLFEREARKPSGPDDTPREMAP